MPDIALSAHGTGALSQFEVGLESALISVTSRRRLNERSGELVMIENWNYPVRLAPLSFGSIPKNCANLPSVWNCTFRPPPKTPDFIHRFSKARRAKRNIGLQEGQQLRHGRIRPSTVPCGRHQ